MLDTVVMSGDDVCCSVVFGTLVGVFVFSVMWSELLMTSAISCPLWSSVYECQRVECAFTSPVRSECGMFVVVVYPLPWPLLVGGVRCSRLWSTSQLLRPSGQQCSHSGGVCPQIQGRQCGAYVGAVEEMMCVVCVDVTEGA